MPPLTLVPAEAVESWDDPEIRAFILDSYRRRVPPVTSLAMEAHQPDVLRAFARFWWASFHHGMLDQGLKERLRVEIASLQRCSYCATNATEPTPAGASVDASSADGAEELAMAFARTLAERPWELDADVWTRLRAAFAPDAIVELIVFCAWQVGGPRVLRSWGAAAYQELRDARPGAVPPGLPYREEAGAEPSWPEREADTADLLDQAARLGSPVAAYLDLLAPRPDLRDAWLGLYLATTHGRTLPPRIGQLVRLDLARLLNCPSWASPRSRALQAVRLDALPFDRLAGLDPSLLDPREVVALRYTRAIVEGDGPSPELDSAIAEQFTEAQRVELGFCVAAQLGPVLVLRSTETRPILAAPSAAAAAGTRA